MSAYPDIAPIRRLVRTTAHRMRLSWIATGMGFAVALGLGALVALALFDLAVPFVEGARVVALALVVVPAAWVFVTGVLRPLFRRLRPAEVARRIERQIPGIHNRLVSCIDLDSAEGSRKVSPQFHERLVREALERIKGFHPRTVVDGRSLRRSGVLAGVSVLALGLAFGLFADRLPTAVARIVSPLADIPPASGVTYRVEPGNTQVLRGDDIALSALVTKGEPDRLSVEIQPDGNGKPLRYDLQKRTPERWSLTLSGLERSFHYRVRGGGTWSTLKRITMVDRPMLAGLRTVLHYPEYMDLPEPRLSPPQTGDVSGPEESAVEVFAKAEGDVAGGEIQVLQTRTKRVEIPDRPERIWFQERLPEGATREGTWLWDYRLLARPAHTEPPARGARTHRFQSAKVPFAVRPGETLFALVYIQPDAKPDAIMLSWRDGQDWEHRAYWGNDTFVEGKPDTPGRCKMGPLPTAGEWVRLEVPAALVNLESALVRGMGFSVSGGQCYWHRAGALPPSHVERPERFIAGTYPMTPAGLGEWSGRFLLERDALYQVTLRNALGHPSKPMEPAKVTAVPDNPPQVVLERPDGDLVLNTPAKVPLSIAAYDDFGLAELAVAVQRGDSGGFIDHPIQHYEHPQRNDNVLASLDLSTSGLKAGEHVRYRVEARDRKGQSAQTREFMVRIAPDRNAADAQLATYEKGQDRDHEDLTKLINAQAKVGEAVEALTDKYAPLLEMLRAADAPKLDPAMAKRLDELRNELAQLGAQEAQNSQLGERLKTSLKQSAEQAANLKLLPPEILRQMQGVPQTFQDRALQPLQDLATALKQGADAKRPPPDLNALKREANRVQQELEATKSQVEATAKARRELRKEPEKAVAELTREMLKQSAGRSARDLQNLKDLLKASEDVLKGLQDQQKKLAEATPRAPELILPDIEKRQGELEPKEDKALNEAQQLLGANSPQNPGPDSSNDAKSSPQSGDPGQGQSVKADGAEGRRDALAARQQKRLTELDKAQQALAGNEQAVDGLLGQLREALTEGNAARADELLTRLMPTPGMRDALAMVQRAHNARRPPTTNVAARSTADAPMVSAEAPIPELDLETRTVILNMQPQLREELLQGLREEGPEGYGPLIRNYFQRLTKVKAK